MAENSLEIRTKIRMAQWHSIMCLVCGKLWKLRCNGLGLCAIIALTEHIFYNTLCILSRKEYGVWQEV